MTDNQYDSLFIITSTLSAIYYVSGIMSSVYEDFSLSDAAPSLVQEHLSILKESCTSSLYPSSIVGATTLLCLSVHAIMQYFSMMLPESFYSSLHVSGLFSVLQGAYLSTVTAFVVLAAMKSTHATFLLVLTQPLNFFKLYSLATNLGPLQRTSCAFLIDAIAVGLLLHHPSGGQTSTAKLSSQKADARSSVTDSRPLTQTIQQQLADVRPRGDEILVSQRAVVEWFLAAASPSLLGPATVGLIAPVSGMTRSWVLNTLGRALAMQDLVRTARASKQMRLALFCSKRFPELIMAVCATIDLTCLQVQLVVAHYLEMQAEEGGWDRVKGATSVDQEVLGHVRRWAEQRDRSYFGRAVRLALQNKALRSLHGRLRDLLGRKCLTREPLTQSWAQVAVNATDALSLILVSALKEDTSGEAAHHVGAALISLVEMKLVLAEFKALRTQSAATHRKAGWRGRLLHDGGRLGPLSAATENGIRRLLQSYRDLLPTLALPDKCQREVVRLLGELQTT